MRNDTISRYIRIIVKKNRFDFFESKNDKYYTVMINFNIYIYKKSRNHTYILFSFITFSFKSFLRNQ